MRKFEQAMFLVLLLMINYIAALSLLAGNYVFGVVMFLTPIAAIISVKIDLLRTDSHRKNRKP